MTFLNCCCLLTMFLLAMVLMRLVKKAVYRRFGRAVIWLGEVTKKPALAARGDVLVKSNAGRYDGYKAVVLVALQVILAVLIWA